MSLLPTVPLAIAMLLTLGAVLVACAGAPAEGLSLPQPAPAARVAEPLAPSFSVSTGKGSAFSLDEHTGEVVILYFSFPG